jgi:hypothetical protein
MTLFASSASAQQALRDITGIEEWPAPPPAARWPYWLAVALASTAVVGLVGWRWGRGRPAGRPLSPDRWALAELDRIAALGLPQTGEAERFHTLVSDVIRRYLELRFDLRAPQRTTPEFLRSLGEQSPLPAERQATLSEFLRRCDIAKFAPVDVSVEECARSLELARTIVQDRIE